MQHDDHILDRAFDQMLARTKACKAVYRTVNMVIGVPQAGKTTTTRGLFP